MGKELGEHGSSQKTVSGREHILSMKIELKDLNSDGNVGIKRISKVR